MSMAGLIEVPVLVAGAGPSGLCAVPAGTDQLVLTDTGTGSLVCASAVTLGESLKEAAFTARDMEQAQCKR